MQNTTCTTTNYPVFHSVHKCPPACCLSELLLYCGMSHGVLGGIAGHMWYVLYLVSRTMSSEPDSPSYLKHPTTASLILWSGESGFAGY